MALKTDYKEDILASGNTRRKYNMITNDDGTVSFEDVTDYTQVGDSFGAGDVNSANEIINQLNKNAHILAVGMTDQYEESQGKYTSYSNTITVPEGTKDVIAFFSLLDIDTNPDITAAKPSHIEGIVTEKIDDTHYKWTARAKYAVFRIAYLCI